ncbi:unnamed protein product, partial [Didymodactylos carnosus]
DTKFYGRIDGQATIKYNTTLGFTDMYRFYSRKTELIEEDPNDNYYKTINTADYRKNGGEQKEETTMTKR